MLHSSDNNEIRAIAFAISTELVFGTLDKLPKCASVSLGCCFILSRHDGGGGGSRRVSVGHAACSHLSPIPSTSHVGIP